MEFGGGALIVTGRWRSTGYEYCIINVYAPCNNPDEKELLWDRLHMVIQQNEGVYTCVIGDFNTILEEGERAGSGGHVSGREMRAFRHFLESSKLLDVDIQGRKFTWYRTNGSCKSRLDRALVNEKWLERWRDTGLRGLPRSISDHCAIVLHSKNTDWGPKPFRFLNIWTSHPGFKELVHNCWGQGGLEGWGCFVFLEKLKRLKEALRIWNREVFGDVDKKISNLREELNFWT